MKKFILLMVMMLLTINCDDNPIKSENNNPVIFSLVVFPKIVEPSDSLIIICNAADPDGDTLVYDWYADNIIRIKGGLPGLPALFNTRENSRIFYAPDSQFVSAPQDTFRIGCAVRDGIGGQVFEHIKFIVKQNSGGN